MTIAALLLAGAVAAADLDCVFEVGPSDAWDGDERTLPIDPDRASLDVGPRALEHLDRVRLIPRVESGPLVHDLHLVGGEGPGLAVRVLGLDFGKFLPRRIEGASDCLVRVQAYFAEFSRKGRTVRTDAAHRAATEARFARSFEHALKDRGEVPPSIRALMDSGPPVELAPLRESLERLGLQDPDLAELVESWALARRIGGVVVVNNCREPGNYELALVDAFDHKLFHASFLIPPDDYDGILRTHHGLGIPEQGTGVSVSGSQPLLEEISAEWRELPRDVPACKLSSLASLGTAYGDPRSGTLRVNRGRIPYEDAENEVRRKSAAGKVGHEPLSYVGVDASLPPPAGFHAPRSSTGGEYWSDPAHEKKVVPHVFATYEDVWRYPVHLSGFTVNGVYVGRSKYSRYDRERTEGRWRFHYGYLEALSRFEVRSGAEGAVELSLLPARPGTGFVIGNVTLEVGEKAEYALGIGEPPLVGEYARDDSIDPVVYALAFDETGRFVDHHGPEVGVERVEVERSRDGYLVRLLSHERILPVWEGIVPM